MTAGELLTSLKARGFHLIPLPGGRLEVKPASKLTDVLREELRKCKAEVLVLLATEAPSLKQEPLQPAAHFWTCCGCGQPVPLSEETERGSQHYVCPNCGSFAVVPREPGKPYTPPPGESFTPGTRDFLPRPLGQEDAANIWDVWAVPLFDWLIEHCPDRFYSVCEAEDALRTLERAGITAGQEYDAACAELLRRFEEARRLKMKTKFKIWLQ